VWGIDTYGSVFKKYKETGVFDKNEIYPYVTEGIGEDFLPQNVDFSVIDHFEKVTDKRRGGDDAPHRRAKRASSPATPPGSAMAGLLQLKARFKAGDVVVVIFHDHGTRYLGKMFNNDWMRKMGYLDKSGLTARDLVSAKKTVPMLSIETSDTVARAVQVMTEHDFSQIPVTQGGRLVGSINESRLYGALVADPNIRTQTVDHIMQPAFPFADISTGIDALATMITADNPAVLVRDFKSDATYVITRSDIVRALA
jgi:cystathionine beta-synthase